MSHCDEHFIPKHSHFVADIQAVTHYHSKINFCARQGISALSRPTCLFQFLCWHTLAFPRTQQLRGPSRTPLQCLDHYPFWLSSACATFIFNTQSSGLPHVTVPISYWIHIWDVHYYAHIKTVHCGQSLTVITFFLYSFLQRMHAWFILFYFIIHFFEHLNIDCSNYGVKLWTCWGTSSFSCLSGVLI